MRERIAVEQELKYAESRLKASREEALRLEALIEELRGALDGFCKKTCDHGHGCALPRHHGGDRHESAGDRCVFYGHECGALDRGGT